MITEDALHKSAGRFLHDFLARKLTKLGKGHIMQLQNSCKRGERLRKMSTIEKLKKRIKKIPKDFTYAEASTLLTARGFKEFNKGKTSGSRVRFYREKDGAIIDLHKPHPKPEMKKYAVEQMVDKLKEYGEL